MDGWRRGWGDFGFRRLLYFYLPLESPSAILLAQLLAYYTDFFILFLFSFFTLPQPFFLILFFFLSSLGPPPTLVPLVTQYDIHLYCISGPLSYFLSSIYLLLLLLLI